MLLSQADAPPHHAPLRLAPQETALLLIDLQEEYREGAPYAVAGYDAILTNAAQLLAAARQAGIAIAHAQYARDFNAAPPRPFEPLCATGDATFSAADAPGTAICPEAAPAPQEALIQKNDASAFDGTTLTAWTQSQNTQWLIIAGVWTEACVAASIRDAQRAGLRVLLVKDACGSGTAAMHQTAILNLANRLYGGGVCDTARAAALIEGKEAPIWQITDPVPLRFEAATITALYDGL